MPLGDPFAPTEPEWSIMAQAGIKMTSETPRITPPVPERITTFPYTSLKDHDSRIRNATLDEIEIQIMKKEEWTRMELLAIIGYNRSPRDQFRGEP